jgi:hypothetical protein
MFLMKGQSWWRIPARPPKFTVRAGQFVDIKEAGRDSQRPIAARALVRQLERYFAEMSFHG